MVRLIVFLTIVAAFAAAATWIADQPGMVALSWSGWRAQMTLPVFALLIAATLLAALLLAWLFAGVLRTPMRMRRKRRERRLTRGRQAVTQGLLAIGHGDAAQARAHAQSARRHIPDDPLTLMLQAQAAQLQGDREAARRAFRAMADRDDTRSLGLRGLFVEAQRNDDPYGALALAEQALQLDPKSPWASHAVLGYRCARGDWSGALEILDSSLAAGLIDKKAHRRQRAVLLTARALESRDSDLEASRESILEAVRLAPTLAPAAVLASEAMAQARQVRRAMKTIEAAWAANPHPDLAAAYAALLPDETAAARLTRMQALAAKAPAGDLEAGLAVARAAVDAGDFARARAALEPLLPSATKRVAMLMAEIEHKDSHDAAAARGWMLRAVRALHDPVWSADGCVSNHWRPVSPVTGKLDAFQWQVPVSQLPSREALVLDSDPFDDRLIAPPAETADEAEPAAEPEAASASSAGDEAPPPPVQTAPPPTAAASPPLVASETVRPFRKPSPMAAAPVIPIVRAPDDPGVDEEAASVASSDVPGPGSERSWRGLLSRREV